MKFCKRLILASLLSTFSIGAQAENLFYAGLSFGSAAYEYNDVDPGFSTKIFAGFNILESVAIEATYFDSGKANITSLAGVSLNSRGVNLAALYRIPAAHEKLSFLAGVGIYNLTTTISAPGASDDQNGLGVSIAAGLEFLLTEEFTLRADVDFFTGAKDFADNQGVDVISVGLIYNF